MEVCTVNVLVRISQNCIRFYKTRANFIFSEQHENAPHSPISTHGLVGKLEYRNLPSMRPSFFIALMASCSQESLAPSMTYVRN